MAEGCIGRNTGECRGPLVADLVIQLKRGRKNVGKAQKFPLCIFHTIKGSAYSWLAHAGETVLLDLVRSMVPRTPRGLHVTHRIVVREPWKKLLRDLGF